MWAGFFQSRKWKNALIGAAVTSLTSGVLAGAQDADLINTRRRSILRGLGFVSGSLATTYTRTGNFTIPKPADLHASTVITFLQIALTEITSPFFEGDKEKAHAWSATTLACVLAGVAACITPPNPALLRRAVVAEPLAANIPTDPTFRERFNAIRTSLEAMVAEEEKKAAGSGAETAHLEALKTLNTEMGEFEEKYQNTCYELMNDPVTIPESGATCDRDDLKQNIAQGRRTCPKTATRLTTSLTAHLATNLDTRNAIDNGLKNFENRFRSLQKNPSLAPTPSEDESASPPATTTQQLKM